MLRRWSGMLACAALLSGCASVSDPVGFAIVAQDRYDFLPCKEAIGARTNQINREKELTTLIEKAESSPGGFIVSYSAYRSELTQTRALIARANRAIQKNGCEVKK